MDKPVNIFWFRRDLRLEDNCGLFHALSGELPVIPLFIFDTNILEELKKTDTRLTFIHDNLSEINKQIRKSGSSVFVRHGKPVEVFKKLTGEYNINSVYTNRDYEPYAINRDHAVEKFLREKGISFHSFKDQVIFEKDDIVKEDGNPYIVYTPYSRKWLEYFDRSGVKPYPSEKHLNQLAGSESNTLPALQDLGFERVDLKPPSPGFSPKQIREYAASRDIPNRDATTHVGPHLRFGTLSIRKLVSKADMEDRTYLKELIWREFFMQILYHFPEVVDRNFKTKFDKVNWLNDEKAFQKWCQGQTGYPMVDAGMRQLNQTGFMHNRVRMITAGFLTKHLLTDWRWGEAYFAEKLFDYELSSNNGNWQWAAGTGCDATPYFRIFNPYEQLKKYDPDRKYVRKWIPELDTKDYPDPMIDHKAARERALKAFKKAATS